MSGNPGVLRVVPSGPLSGVVSAPPSKSATHRALLLAALARGESVIRNGLDADDTRYTAEALQSLGISLRPDGPGSVRIGGCAGRLPAGRADLFLGNAGTSMRFLAAAVTLGEGSYRLDGELRMRERPLGDLVTALIGLGATGTYEGRTGYPPVTLSGGPLQGGSIRLPVHRSSQFRR